MILNLGCADDDYGDVRIDIVKTKSTTQVCDCSVQLPFADETFDEVYEKNFLEHLPNVGFHLKEVNRVLKKGGKLVVITDNAACLKYYTLGTHTGGYHKAYDSPNSEDKHYALFTMEHIKNLMKYADLSITEIKLIDTDYFTSYFDKMVRLLKPSLSYPRISVRAIK